MSGPIAVAQPACRVEHNVVGRSFRHGLEVRPVWIVLTRSRRHKIGWMLCQVSTIFTNAPSTNHFDGKVTACAFFLTPFPLALPPISCSPRKLKHSHTLISGESKRTKVGCRVTITIEIQQAMQIWGVNLHKHEDEVCLIDNMAGKLVKKAVVALILLVLRQVTRRTISG